MSAVAIQNKSGAEVPLEERRFTLVRVHEGEASELIIKDASAVDVESYIRGHCGPSRHLASPSEILAAAPLFVPHSEEWRGGQGEVRISNNPSIGLRRTN